MSISLETFIASKPAELRLGQWFVNCYCKHVDGRWDGVSDRLYSLDGIFVQWEIQMIMNLWQWDSLPDIPSSK